MMTAIFVALALLGCWGAGAFWAWHDVPPEWRQIWKRHREMERVRRRILRRILLSNKSSSRNN
jgi:hypothetical protein